jgi:hypothetical protein
VAGGASLSAGGGVGKIRRTKIVVETERLLVVRPRRARFEGWCEGCGSNVTLVGLDDAALMSGRSQREIVREVEAGTLHFSESESGVLLICLDTLLPKAHKPGKSNRT